MYGIAMLLTLTAPLSPIPAASNAADASFMIVRVDSGGGTGPSTSAGAEKGQSSSGQDTYAGRGGQQSDRNEGKKQPGGDEQHPHHRSVSPSHLGPQGGTTADSGKEKHNQAAQAEQEAAKSSIPH